MSCHNALMNTFFPPALKVGDTIGVMSPSGYVEEADLLASTQLLEQQGYKVYIHPQTYARHHQSAGTSEQKIDALHDLIKRDDIKAIVFAAGGNRALHLLDYLDFNLISKHPKIYMGFSDCTVLLNAITVRTGLITFHGPVLKKLATNNQIRETFDLLSGIKSPISLDASLSIKEGVAQGRLFGGNLATFSALLGSADMPDPSGSIFFFEDINEHDSRLDRTILSLRRANIFNKAAGLIFGQFTNSFGQTNDMPNTGRPFGFTLEDIIREHTDGLNIPVLMNAPFGHGNDLPAFPIGARVRLENKTLQII